MTKPRNDDLLADSGWLFENDLVISPWPTDAGVRLVGGITRPAPHHSAVEFAFVGTGARSGQRTGSLSRTEVTDLLTLGPGCLAVIVPSLRPCAEFMRRAHILEAVSTAEL